MFKKNLKIQKKKNVKKYTKLSVEKPAHTCTWWGGGSCHKGETENTTLMNVCSLSLCSCISLPNTEVILVDCIAFNLIYFPLVWSPRLHFWAFSVIFLIFFWVWQSCFYLFSLFVCFFFFWVSLWPGTGMCESSHWTACCGGPLAPSSWYQR